MHVRLIIIVKVFIKRKIFSRDTILSTCRHKHTCTHTGTCAHTSILTIQNLIYTQLAQTRNRDLRWRKTVAHVDGGDGGSDGAR